MNEAVSSIWSPENKNQKLKMLLNWGGLSTSEWKYLAENVLIEGYNGVLTQEMKDKITEIIEDDFKLHIALSSKNNSLCQKN
jgi:hypothetical protein